MTQNIYDDPDFFSAYSGLRRSIEGLDGAAEWPTLRGMLPDLKGLRIVDLGCGFGWFCRHAREQGAARVVGIDVSDNMLARARADTADPAIDYRKGDLDALELPEGSFDLAYSSLAFHYVADFERLLTTIHAALVPGGALVFSIEHPIYMASRHPDWLLYEHGRRTWPVDGYQDEGRRVTDWLAKGVVKYHRMIGTTLNLLVDAGFQIDRVIEFGPSADQIVARPELAEERERPMFLLVGAHR